MRIIQVITRLNVGGPARHVVLMSGIFARRGYSPLIVHGQEEAGEGSLTDTLTVDGLRDVRLPALRRPVRPWDDVRAFTELVRLVFRECPDVVHTHTAKAGSLGRLAAAIYNLTRRRKDRCVVVHTFHGHVFRGYFSAAGSALVRAVERGLARATDRIITVSARQCGEIVERYRIASDTRVATIEIGTDLDPLLRLKTNTSLRVRCGFGPEHVVFGYVGRFAPIKDLPTLVTAFAAMVGRLPQARLILVGDGEARASIEREVDRLELAGRVVFTGWMRDANAIYGAMDVCVLSSINEGTPLALLEAMAAGRPVVATAVGGVEDIVRHGRNGLIVPAGDVAAMTEAMMGLGTDASRRQRLGEKARQDVARRFDAERVATQILDLYARALSERRAAFALRDTPQPAEVLSSSTNKRRMR